MAWSFLRLNKIKAALSRKKTDLYAFMSFLDDMTANERNYSAVYTEITADLLKAARNSSQTGELVELDTIFRTMKQEWPRLRRNIGKLRSETSRLQYNVMPWSEKDEKPTPEAIKHAKLVESAIFRAQGAPDKWELGFNGLIKFLVESMERGTGVLEITWEAGNIIYPRKYTPIPPYFYRWSTGIAETDRLMLRPDGPGLGEIVFPTDKFIIAINSDGCDHPMYGANLIPLIGIFGGIKFGWQWFLNFCQIFGLPIRKGKADSKESRSRLLKAFREMGASGILVTDTESDAEIIDAMKTASTLPQKELYELADKLCDILLLGNTLTTSTDNSGSRALGDTHRETEDFVVDDHAGFACDIINAQIIPPLLKLNLGHLPDNLPYVTFKRPGSRQSAQKIEFVKGAKEILNGKISREWVYDTLDIPMPPPDADLLEPDKAPESDDEITAAAYEYKKKQESTSSKLKESLKEPPAE